MKRSLSVKFAVVGLMFLHYSAHAKSEKAFEVYGKSVTFDQVKADNKADYYELEKKQYELVIKSAEEAFLDAYFEKKAKKAGSNVDTAREVYLSNNAKVEKKEVDETLERFKDHPQLSKLSKAEQKQQVEDYLKGRNQRAVLERIIAEGYSSGSLKVLLKEPEEPLFDVKITEDDFVRYGPSNDDIKPMGCKSDCPITIVEYSEFECPFCAKVIPDIKRILTEYKGKVRWSMRDFPLSFHPRAKPAAVVAHCAGHQGKFWHMYSKLFENQQKLGDEDFVKYAKDIGVYNKKYKDCVANPAPVLAKIDENMNTGAEVGVSGTPAFFVNGRRLSGAIPYGQFKQVIDSELAKVKK